MRFLSDKEDFSDVKNTDWGNYYDTSLTNLRGFYTNVDSNGATDGFKTVEGTSQLLTKNLLIILTTASTEQVMRKNLYDVAGNLWEWTQEAAYRADLNYNINVTYILRGGSFGFTNLSSPACFRGSIYVPSTYTDYGFRPVLYIK